MWTSGRQDFGPRRATDALRQAARGARFRAARPPDRTLDWVRLRRGRRRRRLRLCRAVHRRWALRLEPGARRAVSTRVQRLDERGVRFDEDVVLLGPRGHGGSRLRSVSGGVDAEGPERSRVHVAAAHLANHAGLEASLPRHGTRADASGISRRYLRTIPSPEFGRMRAGTRPAKGHRHARAPRGAKREERWRASSSAHARAIRTTTARARCSTRREDERTRRDAHGLRGRRSRARYTPASAFARGMRILPSSSMWRRRSFSRSARRARKAR